MEIEVEPRDHQLIYHVVQAKGTIDDRISVAFDDLDAVLDRIARDQAEGHRHFGIHVDIRAEHPSTRYQDLAELIRAQTGKTATGFTPWGPSNAEFWLAVARDAAALPRLERWLEQLGALHLRAQDRTGDAIRETRDYQLGEAALSILALANRAFVPWYTRFMRCWKMPQAASQQSVISELVRRHGLCPETELLLYRRCVETPGQVGTEQIDGLMPQLCAAYGDFTTSPLFTRMVLDHHKRQLEQGLTDPDCLFRQSRLADLREAAEDLVLGLDVAV